MKVDENVSLKKKTTMRIGGLVRYYAELQTREDVEEAVQFAQEKNLPLIVLGGGSNTIFADGIIDALVVKVVAEKSAPLPNPLPRGEGKFYTVQAGKILASLINELAEQNLDLSLLTGIPGTVGGAIFGNAGQGPHGTWIDQFVESIEFFWQGKWQTFTKEECEFGYRESGFKHWWGEGTVPPIIWSVTLMIPSRPKKEVKIEVERLIQKRIETQPHLKTAGSCFKAVGGVPAWKLIDAAGLRGTKIGDVQIAEKHANFLLNIADATFEDAKKIVKKVQESVPEKLEVEMRCIERNGILAF